MRLAGLKPAFRLLQAPRRLYSKKMFDHHRPIEFLASEQSMACNASTTAEVAQSQMHVIADNESSAPSQLSSAEFLELNPRGAYTTARTVGGSSIFELRFHIQRLATSARLMLEAEGASNHESVTEDTLLAPKVMSSIQSAVQTYRQFSGDETSELKVTVLLTWNETGASKVSTHISHMGPRPSRPVKAQVRGAPRNNAEAKDSQWVIQRKQLENQKPTDVNEVLLVGEDGSLYEGLSSNFFALMNGTLYTAEEGVLLGSVREAVLRVCAQHNIPVVLQPPNLKDLHLWEAAFVSSTSRLLLQLDEIQVADTEPAVVRKFEQSDVARKLDKWVYEDVLAHSEPIGGQDDE